jgi:predicted TIM-barrel fold metal-dependent hydrolase
MTFVPPVSDEMPSSEDFIRLMRGNDVRALRVFPARHRFCLDRVSCGLLLELCIAYAIPVFVPLKEFPGQWQGVYQTLRDFPRLTLVVTETGCWGEDRYFRPLMKAYSRFFMSTNRLETAGQLKGIVDAVGPERLLFGSGLPWNCPGGGIMMLVRAQIRGVAKEAIAHGNIERLLKEVAW